MSEIKFRPILESDIREVSNLLNQLKQMDITSIDYKKLGVIFHQILAQIQ